MSTKDFYMDGEKFTACSCHCHRVDVVVKHFLPCCDLTYDQYIREDGTLNEELLDEALRKALTWRRQHRKVVDPTP